MFPEFTREFLSKILEDAATTIVLSEIQLQILRQQHSVPIHNMWATPLAPENLPQSSQALLYKGDLKDGIREGQGTLMWPLGDVYVGQVSGGLREGDGAHTFSSGDIYVGW